MKHIVTLTTSNPSHEHIALRRKQNTTNFMVEAASEDEAIKRASAHFRKLGHYIHEAKVFKKKDNEVNEALGLAIPAIAAGLRTAGVLAKPVLKNLPRALSKTDVEEKLPVPVPAPAPVVTKPAAVHVTRPVPLPAVPHSIHKIPPVLPTPAPVRPVPVPVPLSTTAPVKPTPVPVPAPVPAKDTKLKTKPDTTRLPSPKSDPTRPPPRGPVTPPITGGAGKPIPVAAGSFSLEADRGEVDIGTLGQYRGIFPMYQHADFNRGRIQENKMIMNTIGRVMTKRKKASKENADDEKNKINMEPKLRGGRV